MASINPTVGSVANVQGLDVGETQLFGEWYFDQWDAGPEDCHRSTFVEEDMAEMEVAPQIIIKQDGQVVTNTTRNAIVGQQLNLTGEVRSGSGAITNQQWSIPGNRIANYIANEVNGAVTPLTNLNTASISYYWVDGGDGRQVTYTATVRGKPYTGRATFNVKRPTVNVTTSTGTVRVRTVSFSERIYELVYASTTAPGIRFTRTNLTIPSGFMGDTYWVQLVNASRTRRRNDGTNEVFQETGLDNRFPYASGDPNATETTDSPGLPLTLAYNYATANDSFQMWLMFKPSGTNSIYVPLRKVNWSWSGSAERPGTLNWTLVPGSAGNTPNPPSVDSTEHPQWSSRVTG